MAKHTHHASAGVTCVSDTIDTGSEIRVVAIRCEILEVELLAIPPQRARYSSNPSSAKAYNRKRKEATADPLSKIAPCSVVNSVQLLVGPVNGS